MRTTVNIDDNLLKEARRLAVSTGRPLGEVVNDALRVLLARVEHNRGHGTDFRLPTGGQGGLRPGVDLENKDLMAEVLGDNEAR
ncbi:VapB protein of antitoxin of type II toxin-antitoxin system [Prauserella shujinwangii]|uniref:VapB protein of antitoxin of type II toxin-antitoxin system n=1 Tax=Prauserella shujinwangii TaxID=1453103 RepID=A0A2T0LYS1_9PSEU|nr:type II toxin-antitoxin system VapB family antitoxin [Prauserella shujinwangii]PRX49263.1 VapB protein of antitoxin of type II toxin-antitoxin system [Prauserella shujinwangii]